VSVTPLFPWALGASFHLTKYRAAESLCILGFATDTTMTCRSMATSRKTKWAVRSMVQDLPEAHLADRIMLVAESRSVQGLGAACCSAIATVTGSPTVGLYLLKNEEPELLDSRHVPEGFLDDYRIGLGKSDPLLDSIMSDGGIVDGSSLLGQHGWPRSAMYDLLHSWGFTYNMCGPLRVEDKVVGVFYTATRDAAPYTPLLRDRMGMLCRAGSLALTNMMNSGGLPSDIHVRPASRQLPVMLSPTDLHVKLPPRSAEVAFRVCRGQTNKEIAREMGISDQTVKEHIANLCKRFGVHNRTGLVGCLMSGMSRQ
jgi:DNA-binding CsgD family transcriptional regulator